MFKNLINISKNTGITIKNTKYCFSGAKKFHIHTEFCRGWGYGYYARYVRDEVFANYPDAAYS